MGSVFMPVDNKLTFASDELIGERVMFTTKNDMKTFSRRPFAPVDLSKSKYNVPADPQYVVAEFMQNCYQDFFGADDDDDNEQPQHVAVATTKPVHKATGMELAQSNAAANVERLSALEERRINKVPTRDTGECTIGIGSAAAAPKQKKAKVCQPAQPSVQVTSLVEQFPKSVDFVKHVFTDAFIKEHHLM